jgi:hypothetical protein
MISRRCLLLLFALASFLPAGRALGQATAGGLFRPWPTDQNVDGDGGLTLLDAGHVKGSDDGLRLSTFESEGRWRLSQEHALNPTVGYALRSLDFHSDSPVLPNSLTDVSVGFATPITQFDTGWFMAASAGVGYAGDSAFGDGAAWYGRGTIIFGKPISNDNALLFGIDYDGNRTIFPDIPLPGFAWSTDLGTQLKANIGFPYNTVFWQPRHNVRVELYYTIPSLFELKVGYNPAEDVLLFADFRNTFTAYHMENFPADRRLFFDDMRLEAGVRWQPYKLLGITAAAGYAFQQELHRGFDSRNMDSVARLSDEPYLRVALEWKY